METGAEHGSASSMYPLVALFFSLLFPVNRISWIQGTLAMNVLVHGPYADPNTMNVTVKQYLSASNFYLVMEPNCNLVTYNGSIPYLTTGSSPTGPSSTWNCYATLQADGNFVVYQKPNDTTIRTAKMAAWASRTPALGFNSTYRFLILRGNGSLSMYEPDGTQLKMRSFIPVNGSRVDASSPAPAMSHNAASNRGRPFPPELAWKPNLPLDGYPYMPAEYFLSQGSKLITTNGRFILMLGHDCKLQSKEILNNTVKRVIWDPQQSMSGVVNGNCQLMLRHDGRLEIRDNASGVMFWNGSISRNDTVSWVLKVNADDGHVSVSDILEPSNILWTTSEAVLSSRSGAASIWPTVVGVIGGFLFVAIVVLRLWYTCIRPKSLNPNEKAFQRRLLSIGGKSRVLSEAKLKQATKKYQDRIGYGGFGDVFYGKLEGGQEIAAKVLSSGSHQSKKEFYNEIELLSMVHHKYLVNLVGYSFTPKNQVLIYEFMSGGDLRHRLSQGSCSAGNVCAGNSVEEGPLTWRHRTSIILQVAEGIEYLHDRCTPAIIHRDIKSNNILLTKELVAKVADFGLSKLRTIDQENATHITTVVKGTPGYLDPEYHKTGLLTEKSDVYAFGIVLMEILTGQQQMHIAKRVFEARRSGKLAVLVDPQLNGDYGKDEFVDLVDLSLWCVRKNRGNRPFMRQVVQRLREILVAPLESSAQPKVIESKDDQHNVVESENPEEVTSNDAVPFSGFSTGNIKSGTWRLDQFGDSSSSDMLDHNLNQSSFGNPEIS